MTDTSGTTRDTFDNLVWDTIVSLVDTPNRTTDEEHQNNRRIQPIFRNKQDLERWKELQIRKSRREVKLEIKPDSSELLLYIREQIKNSLYVFYGEENCDFIETNISNPENIVSTLDIQFMIKFPDFQITNRYNALHLIQGLYLKYRFLLCYNEGDKKVTLRSFKINGYRDKITKQEKLVGYVHSHINGPGGYYCFGGGLIVEYLADLNTYNFNIEKFEALLVVIESALEFEDLDGGPHRTIKQLENRASSTGHIYYNNPQRDINFIGLVQNVNILRQFFLNRADIPLTISPKGTIDIDHLELNVYYKNISNILSSIHNQASNTTEVDLIGILFPYSYQKINGIYHSLQGGPGQDRSLPSFSFKKQTIQTKVINNDDTDKTELKVYIPKPLLKSMWEHFAQYSEPFFIKKELDKNRNESCS